MKTISLVSSIVALTLWGAVPSHSEKPVDTFDPAAVESEILAHVSAFNGRMAGVELWDSYFVEFPRVGNIHNDRFTDLGWEQWHKSNVEFFSAPRAETVQFSDLQVHPIRRDLAWSPGSTASRSTARRGRTGSTTRWSGSTAAGAHS